VKILAAAHQPTNKLPSPLDTAQTIAYVRHDTPADIKEKLVET
jgi:hypothetical protein